MTLYNLWRKGCGYCLRLVYIYMKDRASLPAAVISQILCLDWTLLSWGTYTSGIHIECYLVWGGTLSAVFRRRRHRRRRPVAGFNRWRAGGGEQSGAAEREGEEENDPSSSLQLLIGSFSPTSASPLSRVLSSTNSTIAPELPILHLG